MPLKKLLKDYYKVRGWNNGIPEYRTLRKLGIELYRDYYDNIVKEAENNG